MRRTMRHKRGHRTGGSRRAHRGKACRAVKTLCAELKKRADNKSCKLHRAARKLCKHTTCKTHRVVRK